MKNKNVFFDFCLNYSGSIKPVLSVLYLIKRLWIIAIDNKLIQRNTKLYLVM